MREITPELALDALGVTRISEEILGLAVARRVVDQFTQDIPKNGFTAWISLDAHKHWFSGGESSTRADMIKLTFDTSDEQLTVGLTVLESKLRKDAALDRHADTQVHATLNLMEQIVSPEYVSDHLDGQMWRSNLLGAIRNSGAQSVSRFGNEVDSKKSIDLAIGSAFIDGDFNLSWLNGLTVQSVTSGDISDSIQVSPKNDRISNIKVGITGILKVFDGGLPLSEAVISQVPETMWCSDQSVKEPVKDPDLKVNSTTVDDGESVGSSNDPTNRAIHSPKWRLLDLWLI